MLDVGEGGDTGQGIGDAADEIVDAYSEETRDSKPAPDHDGYGVICPDALCEIGMVNCLTDEFERICIAFDEENCPDLGVWGEITECVSDAICIPDQGCVCDLGACSPPDIVDCVAPQPLAPNEEWICIDGCCAIQAIAGLCTTAAECDDDDPCTQDLCDLQLNTCVNTEKVDAGMCDDGDPCTLEDCNQLSGDCIWTFDPNLPGCGGTPCWGNTQAQADETCFIDPCIVHDCSFAGGFQSWQEPFAPNCDTQPQYCGFCSILAMVDCDDSNPCTDDSCDPAQGCVYAPNSAPCNDGDACTTGDTCQGGACGGTGILDCDDGCMCTADSCVAGACQNDVIPGCCAEEIIDGMESDFNDPCGMDGWVASPSADEVTVAWQASDAAGQTPGEDCSLYFGDPVNGGYDLPGDVPQGIATSPTWEIPVISACEFKVQFWLWMDLEDTWSLVDTLTLYMGLKYSPDLPPAEEHLIWSKPCDVALGLCDVPGFSEYCALWGCIDWPWSQWEHVTVNLPMSLFDDYSDLVFWFEFDAKDDIKNDGVGVFIDDFQVMTHCP